MSKQNEHNKQIDVEQKVMEKILSNKIKMKPKWYFVLGSLLSVAGLSGLFVVATFSINILLFLAHKRGLGIRRLEYMLESFPMWLPILAVFAIAGGIYMLKKFEFSYKANFKLVSLGFVLSIFTAALLIHLSGLNEVWSKRGPMKNFYERKIYKDKKWHQNTYPPRGPKFMYNKLNAPK